MAGLQDTSSKINLSVLFSSANHVRGRSQRGKRLAGRTSGRQKLSHYWTLEALSWKSVGLEDRQTERRKVRQMNRKTDRDTDRQ